jgi:GTP-binding protein
MEQLPVIALVGRPNVGKSTLFNRLTRTRDALVADVPGLTRDRHYAPALLDGRRVVLIDTGGFEPIRSEGVAALMAQQTRQAILEADLVVLVTDGRHGLAPRDLEIANELRRATPHVLVAVNKTEGMRSDVSVAEFHRLGLGEPVAISSAHGDGIGTLVEEALARLADRFPQAREPAPEDAEDGVDADAAGDAGAKPASDGGVHAGADGEAGSEAGDRGDGEATPDAATGPRRGLVATGPIRVAVVGRPNGGKSTMINALLGEERLVAFDQPGTTRDAIDVPFRFDGREFILVDTAGIRRRAKVSEAIEKFSVVKTLQAIERSNVCILVIDAADGISEQDASIASYIVEAGRALVVALNKWDSIATDERKQVSTDFARKLHFLGFAALHTVSAVRRTGLRPMMRSVIDAHRAAMSKLPTPRLTRLLQQAVAHQQPARQGPIRPKLRYAHQGGQNPPIIVIHGSALNRVDDSYRRFLERWFAEHLSLRGTPLRIEFKTNRNPYAPASAR